MKSRLYLVLVVGLLGIVSGGWRIAFAAEIPGLYQATAPVESRENERQRTRAFAIGMQEMLIKLTGKDDIRTQPAIQSALASPQSYVESWAYQTRPDPLTHEQKLMIDISFYKAGIQRLLNNAGIAVWPQNRPETLVWMIVQDEKGDRMLSDPNAGTGTDVLQALQTQAALRGLPVLSPLWDLEDRTVMQPDLLWLLDEPTLRIASRRYNYESMLAVRIVKTVGNQIVGKAVHVFRGQVHETEMLDGNLTDFLNATVSMVARELADTYGVLLSSGPEDSNESQLMLVKVEGIHGLSDYAGVLQYLGGQAGVSQLQVREVAADTLTLSLNVAGQVRQLVDNLAIDRKLQALGNPVMESGQVQLHYRWQTQ